jgi:hypothetical protein
MVDENRRVAMVDQVSFRGLPIFFNVFEKNHVYRDNSYIILYKKNEISLLSKCIFIKLTIGCHA